MTRALWVAVLNISPRTAQKITEKHRLDPEDVRAAVQTVAGLEYVWDDDPERGLRAIVRVVIHGGPVLVVLYPVEHPLGGVFHLGSAYPLSSRGGSIAP